MNFDGKDILVRDSHDYIWLRRNYYRALLARLLTTEDAKNHQLKNRYNFSSVHKMPCVEVKPEKFISITKTVPNFHRLSDANTNVFTAKRPQKDRDI